jgi:sugar/nucleoside kinase (ribokinase family)
MKTFDLAIAGEVNLDLILYGLPSSMPEERELLATGFCSTLGGSSAIVAHNAAMLGSRVTFQTLVGPDAFGRIAIDKLREAGVDVSHTRVHRSTATGLTVLLPHGAERHILTFLGTIAELTVGDLDFDRLLEARHLHLSSLYLQRGLHAGLPDLLRRLKAGGLSVSLDTNDDPEDQWGVPLFELLPYVDVFLPSEDELLRMARRNDIESAIDVLSQHVETIVVKRGRRGARIHIAGRSEDIPAVSVVPVDTVGAGDSFDAGFLHSYLLSKDLVTCARVGNITGALSTQGQGGTEAFRNEVTREAFLRRHGFFELLA